MVLSIALLMGCSSAEGTGEGNVEGDLDGSGTAVSDTLAVLDTGTPPADISAEEDDTAVAGLDADVTESFDSESASEDGAGAEDVGADEDSGAVTDDTQTNDDATGAVDTTEEEADAPTEGDTSALDATPAPDTAAEEDVEVDSGSVNCADGDEDGFCVPEDCNDSEAGINPDAEEFCGDEIDNDCDSETDEGCDDGPTVIDETTCDGAAAALTSAGCLFAPIVGNPSSVVTHGPLPWAVIAANANESATDVTLYAPTQPCTTDVECGHCGDGVCSGVEPNVGIESSASCEADCGATCGDEACNGDEDNAGCPLDCPSTCGNGSCDTKETSVLCPQDCAAICGDHACTNSETTETCPADCGVMGVACTDGVCPSKVLETAVIEGGELHIFEIEGPINAAWELGKETGVFDKVFRLEATRPIVAYQFQPYSSSYAATADAALLLPKHAWGNNHLVLNQKGSGNTWVTIMTLDDDVVVRVRMPEVMNGPTVAGGPIPAMSAGEVHLIPLKAGQAVRVYATPLVDLSGMGIFSGDKDVAVMVGSPGTSLPGPFFVPYNDLLEEQLPPRTAWGTDVGVVKFKPITDELDVYRVMADKDGTTVTISGDVEAVYALDEGEFAQFESAGSFHVHGSDAILVAHGMVSAQVSTGVASSSEWPGWFEATNNCGPMPAACVTDEDCPSVTKPGKCEPAGTCVGEPEITCVVASDCPNKVTVSICDANAMCASAGQSALQAALIGDPALSFVTPSAQYRNTYVFLTPDTYAWDVLTIIAPDWAWEGVSVDDLPLPAPTPVAGSEELSYARFLISDGRHHVESPLAGVGIEVHGYDCRLSYAYAGGLSLGAINEPPPVDELPDP
jgi:hypothetical protein